MAIFEDRENFENKTVMLAWKLFEATGDIRYYSLANSIANAHTLNMDKDSLRDRDFER